MVRVKICGITNPGDARAAVELGADALGFVFAHSPRQITPERARKLAKSIPPFITPVGVFVDEELEKVQAIARFCGLGAVQLHGNESTTYAGGLRGKYSVIKAFRIRSLRELVLLRRYRVDAFLLDSYEKGRPGGTGKTFPWEIARRARSFGPIILAGGLNPYNVREAIEMVRPFAVDVSSGVEIRPGKKDRHLMRQFIEAAKGP